LREHAVDPQRPSDVLEALLADICELGINFASDLAECVFRDADAAGFGDPSSRAAMLTLSPWMWPSSTIMSPTT
jgi:hypothetical protein